MPSTPVTPFTINGGCNCGAIRYRITVPAHSERIPTPYRTPGADIEDDDDLRLPAFIICHCNDCRTGSSGIVLAAILADLYTVEARIAAAPDKSDGPAHSESAEWKPASQVFDKPLVLASSGPLAVYESSPLRSRWFCRVCGTPFAYNIDAEHPAYSEWKWPLMLDIFLGTVDREDLERDWMVPERRLWCEPGVPWIRKLIAGGSNAAGLPSHPGADIGVMWEEPEGVGEK